MTEYSDAINYFDWPPEWRLDQSDELQIAANVQGTMAEVRFYRQIIKQLEKEIDTEESILEITKPRKVL